MLRFARNCKQRSSLDLKFLHNIQIHLKNTSPYRFVFKFEVKFVNLSRRNPYHENDKFKICGATAPDKPARSAATSHVQWGRWGFLRRCASNCKQTGAGLPLAVASAMARRKGKGRSTLASLCLLPSPYGLETATLVAASPKAANAERKAEQTVSSSACSCESQAKQSLFRLPRKRKTKKF